MIENVKRFEDHTVEFQEKIVFDINKKDLYLEEMKKEEVLEGISYEDNHWVIKGKRNYRNFYFPFQLHPFYNDLLKCFTIQGVLNSTQVDYLFRKVTLLSELLHFTNFFNAEMVQETEDFILLETPRFKQDMYFRFMKEIYSFSELSEIEPYISRLEGQIKYHEYGTRTLPNFEDILSFNHIVHSFFNQPEMTKQHEKFLPIFIWWRLTMIIPMRPEEFCTIKRNDLIKTGNDYILKIRRIKDEESRVKPQTDFPISNEIGELIESYIQLSDLRYEDVFDIEEKEFLFPIYMRYLYLSDKGKRTIDWKLVEGTKSIHPVIFYNLLNDFYEEVAGTDLERLTPNDTRHLAICSMRMQGFNPLSIARMAGHERIETQNHYANHLETFLESKITLLVESIREKNIYNADFFSDSDIERLSVVQYIKTESALMVKNKKTLMKIDNGYCSDEAFPNNCIQNCLLCPYFRFELAKNKENKQLLKDTARKLNKDYLIELESYHEAFKKTLEYFSKKDVVTPPVELNEKLRSSAQKINDLVEKIARNKAMMLNIEEGEM